jgi:gliding motility-associated-like protein
MIVLPNVEKPSDIIVLSGSEPSSQITNETNETYYFSQSKNSTLLHWTVSNPLAGIIDNKSGVMTWRAGFYGIVDIQVMAIGCKGPTENVIRTVMVKKKDEEINTFTPNGDGTNDIFMEGVKIKIFNRNHILLFEGNNGWDGTSKGKLLARDTYYYIIEEKWGSVIDRKFGVVTLIR